MTRSSTTGAKIPTAPIIFGSRFPVITARMAISIPAHRPSAPSGGYGAIADYSVWPLHLGSRLRRSASPGAIAITIRVAENAEQHEARPLISAGGTRSRRGVHY